MQVMVSWIVPSAKATPDIGKMWMYSAPVEQVYVTDKGDLQILSNGELNNLAFTIPSDWVTDINYAYI